MGAILGVLSLTDQDDSPEPDLPSVVNLAVQETVNCAVPETPRAGRAADLRQVEISFDIVERTGELVDISVEFSSGSAFREARVLGKTKGLATSPSGVCHELIWLAADDGLSGYQTVDLRITPRDGNGEGFPATLRVPIGNDAPVVKFSNDILDVDAASGSGVVVTYDLEDSSGDQCWVELLVTCDGCFPPVCCFLPVCPPPEGSSCIAPCAQSICTEALERQRTNLSPGRRHDLIWDSLAILGRTDHETVRVALIVDDGLPDGRNLTPVSSNSFRVYNNSPPEVVIVETLGTPDSEGSVLLSFLLLDKDVEDERADVVLQWSTTRESFRDLPDLSDPEARHRLLLDPDERAAFQVITPSLRTMVEGSCRTNDPQRIELIELSPPSALSSRFEGMVLEILSDTGVVEAARRIILVEPATRRVTLESPLDPPPRIAQRARIRESADRLLLDLVTSTAGVAHEVAWDVPADASPTLPEASYFLRGLAFSAGGRRSGPAFITGFPRTIRARGARFAEREVLRTEPDPAAVLADDLNADGRPDLACAEANGQTPQIAIYLQGKDGQFSRGSTLVTGRGPVSLATGDLNEDGHLDLISADSENTPPQLSIFLGVGDGSFEAVPALRTDGRAKMVLATDLDRDGHLDLAAPCHFTNPPSLWVFHGRGGGTFDPPLALRTGDRPVFVIAPDLNADGRPDLVTVDSLSSQLSLFIQREKKVFEGSSLSTGQGPVTVAAADLNDDGQLDLVSADSEIRRLSIFLGVGGGFFRDATMDAAPLETGEDPTAIVAADLDGDFLLDLISADSGADQLSIFPGMGGGRFARPSIINTGRSPSSVAAVDLDGDDVLDLATADRASSEMSVFLGRDYLSFSGSSTLRTGVGPLSLLSADLDGDGHLELVTADAGDNQLSIFAGLGHGRFGERRTVETGVRPRGLAAADIDGDGRLDVICTNTQSDDLTILLGGENGRLEDASGDGPRLRTGGQPRSVLAEDLDRDGWIDLATADFALAPRNGQLSVFKGLGEGQFDTPLVTPVDGHPNFVAAHDLDRDGSVDLVSATDDDGDGFILLFLGNGTADFREIPPLRFRVGNNPRFVRVVDLDGNGFQDLVSADRGAGQLSVFLGTGAGVYGERRTLEVGLSPLWVSSVDLDMDGHLDLVSADFDSDQLSVLRGIGHGRFGSAVNLVTGRGPVAVLSVDLDGDGTLDLAVAENVSNRISILLSRASRTERPAASGIPRVLTPTSGRGNRSFAPDPGRHIIHTSSGTIDGELWPDFAGHAFHFRSITIGEGVTVEAVGEYPLVLLSQEEVDLAGKVLCGGAPGESAGLDVHRAGNSGAAGGRGGPGAGKGGAGGGTRPGSGEVHGSPGHGPGGGAGGEMAPGPAGSGAGGGYATAGGSQGSARGGGVYGNCRLAPLFGGSGGGGGSILDGSAGIAGALDPGGDQGGGGGGGGGGAVRITAGGDIRVSGTIHADGGQGGRGLDGLGGHGGGGSGGSVLLQSYGKIELTTEARITALGGDGGKGAPALSGGAGGGGRIRFEDADGVMEVAGSVAPEPSVARIPVGPLGIRELPGQKNSP